MAEEASLSDPYAAVLADLQIRRDQIDQAILAIEQIRGKDGASASTSSKTKGSNATVDLLGMSIVDAAKKLLAIKRTALKNNDLAVLFKEGGLMLNSKDWVNTIGAVLSRRANEVGDIVKIDRGTWGLKDWYPNRSFKKEAGQAAAKSIGTPNGFVRSAMQNDRIMLHCPEGQYVVTGSAVAKFEQLDLVGREQALENSKLLGADCIDSSHM